MTILSITPSKNSFFFFKLFILKKYIESKEDLDAEIPSDDDEEEKSDEKELKGLSRKERDLIKSIK